MIADSINALSRFFYERALGLLVLRVATGLIFFLHGWAKVNDMMQTVGMFSHMGFPVWVAYFIGWLETIGGLALILGIATRFFGVVFGIEMLVATFVVGFGRGLGIEFYLAAVSFAIALMGSGRFSVFSMECERCGGMLCDGESCAVLDA
ncbi:MAG TPA: DoxX family protein [Candidatus Paceibacterota bacterium]|nr:DoxX family protein [Candidatus Paceibacterota bacterium]